MTLCYQIKDDKIEIINDVFVNCKRNAISYLEDMRDFYCYLTGLALNVSFYICDLIPALCISGKGRIIFKSSLIAYRDAAMFLYFPHEIFHQLIGNRIKIVGRGNLWIKESLTEYLQLLYIKNKSRRLFQKQVKFYLERYHEYMDFDISIFSINQNTEDECIKATIESKGVLIFLIYFSNIEECNIRQLLQIMSCHKYIDVLAFLDLCKALAINSQGMYKDISTKRNAKYFEYKINEAISI